MLAPSWYLFFELEFHIELCKIDDRVLTLETYVFHCEGVIPRSHCFCKINYGYISVSIWAHVSIFLGNPTCIDLGIFIFDYSIRFFPLAAIWRQVGEQMSPNSAKWQPKGEIVYKPFTPLGVLEQD